MRVQKSSDPLWFLENCLRALIKSCVIRSIGQFKDLIGGEAVLFEGDIPKDIERLIYKVWEENELARGKA